MIKTQDPNPNCFDCIQENLKTGMSTASALRAAEITGEAATDGHKWLCGHHFRKRQDLALARDRP